jgi:hypothetical protein
MQTSKVFVILLLCSVSVTAVTVSALTEQETTATGLTAAAGRLLAALSPKERQRVQMDYATPERSGWHFIPKTERKGLALRDMNAHQQKLTLKLLQAALSQAGYTKATIIMQLESILATLEGKSGTHHLRDPLLYYITIFGKPNANDRWGLSFEGHHLSLNFVIHGARIVASTPQFLGANPADVKGNYIAKVKKGTRVLRKEETLAFDLLHALSEDQKKKAIVATKAPAEIRHPGNPQPPKSQVEGLAATDMTEKQQTLLRQLLEAYLSTMPHDVAQGRRQRLNEAGFGNIYFAWAGATEPHVGHYYRIEGPTLLVDFVNTQPDPAGNPANHIHCVWRNPSGDFALPAKTD